MVSYVMIQGDLDAEDTKNRTEYSVKTLTDQGIRVQKLTEVSGNWEESRGKELTEQAEWDYPSNRKFSGNGIYAD